jgi:hypothetical protein
MSTKINLSEENNEDFSVAPVDEEAMTKARGKIRLVSSTHSRPYESRQIPSILEGIHCVISPPSNRVD